MEGSPGQRSPGTQLDAVDLDVIALMGAQEQVVEAYSHVSGLIPAELARHLLSRSNGPLTPRASAFHGAHGEAGDEAFEQEVESEGNRDRDQDCRGLQ